MGASKKINLNNLQGLSFDFLENGTIRSIDAGNIGINLKAATHFSKSGVNLYLRKRENPIEYKAILGPESNSEFSLTNNQFFAKGNWDGLDYKAILQLSPQSFSWQWTIHICNNSGSSVELDTLLTQDVGLKPPVDGPVNEYYVSQYIERLILVDKTFGKVLCCRQNTRESVGNPWFMMACKNLACSACSDGMQFLGKTFRETGIPEGLLSENLGGEYAGESAITAIQEKSFFLAAGEEHKSIFVATYLPDHPSATSQADLEKLPALFREFQHEIIPDKTSIVFKTAKNIFNSSAFLSVENLNNEDLNHYFGTERRQSEYKNGELLSFFYNKNTHVTLHAKEILADRPHGHIMQAKAACQADENIISTTSFAFGVFNSHLTRGNTNFNVFLSICTTQFNQSPESGQRIFVEIDGRRYLLGIPSAFEMGLNHCRWIYKFGNQFIQIRTWTSKTENRVNLDFNISGGKKPKLLITHQLDKNNGWTLMEESPNGNFVFKPKADSMMADKFPQAQFQILVNSKNTLKSSGDETLHENNQSRGDSFFILDIDETDNFCMSFIAELFSHNKTNKIENSDKQFAMDCHHAQSAWNDLSLNLSLQGKHKDTEAIQEILPWFGMNALTHFLTPHGLEQFGGAAWGTRDVAQGPFDLLMSFEKYQEAKQVLRIIFSNQNPTGDWAQWWMFDSYFTIRAADCHGDIYYWCMIALSNYISITDDIEFLDEVLPYYHENGPEYAEKTTLSEHIERLIQMIVNSFIPGTSLVPFGGGDWNDSLQPVNKELAQRMISSWTVEMNYQAFNQYRAVYERVGYDLKANELSGICDRIKTDFNKHLVKDGVVAGYGLLEKDNTIGVLLHPSDSVTNINYSILPMNRGIISGIFTKEQAFHHQQLIDQYLKGPDGARLMDRPLKYKGGIQSIFQRAESASHFGREIGLMYVHEHIRYAESQAIIGNADAFIQALRQANPVGYSNVVPSGDIRQANCYYSSSDVAFKSRYEADEKYDEIKNGKITLRGGWRIYSSGPGIYISLVVSRLLGIRAEFEKITIDPVIPDSMNGLSASINFMGHSLVLKYTIQENNYGPKKISINDTEVKFKAEYNPYRAGGAIIQRDEFIQLLDRQINTLEITI